MAETDRRVALITGCGKENGIGAATAQKLARDGFIVAVSDVAAAGVDNDNTVEKAPSSWQGLDSLVARIEEAGGSATSFTGDVSTEDGAAHLVNSAIEKYGRLDALVNNAGAPHGQDRGQIETVPLDAWENVMAINVRGPFLMSRAAVPHMKSRGYGRIVSLASVAGLEALPERAAYCASKAAVIGLTKVIGKEFAEGSGITCNCLAPAVVRTEMVAAMPAAQVKYMTDKIPMKRTGEESENAAMICFIASRACSFTTGFCFDTTGGRATY